MTRREYFYKGKTYIVDIIKQGKILFIKDAKNIQVGTLARGITPERLSIYAFDFDESAIKEILKTYNGGRLDTLFPGIDFEEIGGYVYLTTAIPYFVEMRVPDRRRTDIDKLCKRIGLNYYDDMEFLFHNGGMSLDEWRVDRD
jgi:hypothetical protein